MKNRDNVPEVRAGIATDHRDLRAAEWVGSGVGRRVPLASAEGTWIVGHEGRRPRACGRDHVLRCELTFGRI